MIKNCLSEKNNMHPCLRVNIDQNKGSAILEMCSVEEMHRFLKVESKFISDLIKFLAI